MFSREMMFAAEVVKEVFALAIGASVWGVKAQEVAIWQHETFGPHTLEANVLKYFDELREFRQTRAGTRERKEEAADCFFMAVGCVAAGSLTVPLTSIGEWCAYLDLEAFEQKFATNRARKWGLGDDGTFSHIGADGRTGAERAGDGET